MDKIISWLNRLRNIKASARPMQSPFHVGPGCASPVASVNAQSERALLTVSLLLCPRRCPCSWKALDEQFVDGKHFRRCPQTVIVDSMPPNWKIKSDLLLGWESVLPKPFSLGAGEGGSHHICILDFSCLAQWKGSSGAGLDVR